MNRPFVKKLLQTLKVTDEELHHPEGIIICLYHVTFYNFIIDHRDGVCLDLDPDYFFHMAWVKVLFSLRRLKYVATCHFVH